MTDRQFTYGSRTRQPLPHLASRHSAVTTLYLGVCTVHAARYDPCTGRPCTMQASPDPAMLQIEGLWGFLGVVLVFRKLTVYRAQYTPFLMQPDATISLCSHASRIHAAGGRLGERQEYEKHPDQGTSRACIVDTKLSTKLGRVTLDGPLLPERVQHQRGGLRLVDMRLRPRLWPRNLRR